MSSNWSCILHEDQLVIHCEETDAAYQHFYPMALLATYARKFPEDGSAPVVTHRVRPYESICRKYRFPSIPALEIEDLSSTVSNPSTVVPVTVPGTDAVISPTTSISSRMSSASDAGGQSVTSGLGPQCLDRILDTKVGVSVEKQA
jgi:hypothetical protein